MSTDAPQRWQRSYASELDLDMTDEDVSRVLEGHLPELLEQESKFPKSMPLRGILKFDGRVRRFQDEEIIVRKGDYGSSVFVILSGEIRLLQRDLPSSALGRTENTKVGFGQLLARVFSKQGVNPEFRKSSAAPESVEKKLGSVHLEDFPEFVLEDSANGGTSEARLNPDTFTVAPNKYSGAVFGELAALGRTPRTVTVLAKGETELLEIRWQGLREIRRFSDAWRKMIDERYRRFALETALNTAPFAKSVWGFHSTLVDKLRNLDRGEGAEKTLLASAEDGEWLPWLSTLEYAYTRGEHKGGGDSAKNFSALIRELSQDSQGGGKAYLSAAGVSFSQALAETKNPDRALAKCPDPAVVADACANKGAARALRLIANPGRVAPSFAELLRQTQFESHGKMEWFGSYKQLAEKSAREKLKQEPVISRQGEYPNGLVLIRGGFARVSHTYNYGEKTTHYLGKGKAFGFIEIYANYLLKQKGGEAARELVPMQNSLRAIGYTDVLVIPTAAVEANIIPLLSVEDYECGARPAEKMLEEREKYGEGGENVRDGQASGLGQDVLEFLVETRAINGTASMLINLDRCTRCDDCVRACSESHGGNPRFARHGRTHDNVQLTNACMHCADPVCMIGCPTGAISRNEIGGQVAINDSACIGCATCANSCPYDNIQMVEIRDKRGQFRRPGDEPANPPIMKATKCDLCASELTGPACLNACPHDALIRINLNDPENLVAWLNR